MKVYLSGFYWSKGTGDAVSDDGCCMPRAASAGKSGREIGSEGVKGEGEKRGGALYNVLCGRSNQSEPT